MFTLEQLKVEEEQAAEWEISKTPPHDVTALGRGQQTKALFSAGRSEAMKRLSVEGVPASILVQAMSALYSASSDEKRWVDGILARKNGLGC